MLRDYQQRTIDQLYAWFELCQLFLYNGLTDTRRAV